MKFEDTHIGGRELGPVQFAFSGDDKAGQRLVNFGRTVLGNLKQRMQMAGVMAQETEVRLDDGSTVYASSILGQDGAADIDRVGIFVPVKEKKKKKEFGDIGFVIHVYALPERFTWFSSSEYTGLFSPLTIGGPSAPVSQYSYDAGPELQNTWGGFCTAVETFTHTAAGSGSDPNSYEFSVNYGITVRRGFLLSMSQTASVWDPPIIGDFSFESYYHAAVINERTVRIDNLMGLASAESNELKTSVDYGRGKCANGFYYVSAGLAGLDGNAPWTNCTFSDLVEATGSLGQETELVNMGSKPGSFPFTGLVPVLVRPEDRAWAFINRSCASFVLNPGDVDKRIVFSAATPEQVMNLADSPSRVELFPTTPDFRSPASGTDGIYTLKVGLTGRIDIINPGYDYLDNVGLLADIQARLSQPVQAEVRVVLLPSRQEFRRTITFFATDWFRSDSPDWYVNENFNFSAPHMWQGSVRIEIQGGVVMSVT